MKTQLRCEPFRLDIRCVQSCSAPGMPAYQDRHGPKYADVTMKVQPSQPGYPLDTNTQHTVCHVEDVWCIMVMTTAGIRSLLGACSLLSPGQSFSINCMHSEFTLEQERCQFYKPDRWLHELKSSQVWAISRRTVW